MKSSMQIVVAGRNKDDLDRVAQLASSRKNAAVQKRLIVNGHADPLQGVQTLPEILVYCASREWREELTALSERPVRPVTIVVARDMDPAMMRLAMRAGAREFLSAPDDTAELATILEALEAEHRAAVAPKKGRIVALLGAKGGVGTSTIAANLAYALARGHHNPLLLDLDVQTGEVGSLFDLPPNDGLREALMRIDTLDQLALGGYVVKHVSGVSLLTSAPDQMASADLPPEKLETLLRLAASTHDFVIVDLPRRVDQGTGTVLGIADEVLLVLQQSVTHLRGGKRVTQLLSEFGMNGKKVTAVVNRYDHHAAISTDDVKEALRATAIFTLPNDFSLAAQASDLGAPVLQSAPNSKLGRRIMELAERLSGETKTPPPSGGFARLISKLSKR
jgi:pilus assembly protein CpaE